MALGKDSIVPPEQASPGVKPDELPGDEAKELAGAELDEAAREEDIEGRSSMTADEKRAAVAKAERPDNMIDLADSLAVSPTVIARQMRELGIKVTGGRLSDKNARAIAAGVRAHEKQGRAVDTKYSP